MTYDLLLRCNRRKLILAGVCSVAEVTTKTSVGMFPWTSRWRLASLIYDAAFCGFHHARRCLSIVVHAGSGRAVRTRLARAGCALFSVSFLNQLMRVVRLPLGT